MTGEEHRTEAERLLALAAHDRRDATPTPAELTAQAQVHATLYLADMQAATGRTATLQLSLMVTPTESYLETRDRLRDLLSRERTGWSV